MTLSVFLLLTGIAALAVTVVFLGRVVTLVWLLLMLTYKSTLISIFSCDIDDTMFFRVLQAVDFVFAGTVALVVLAISPPVRAGLLRIDTVAARNMAWVTVVLVYGTLLGLALNTPEHVAMYLRLLLYPVLLYIVGIWLAHRLEWRVVVLCAVMVLLPAALLIYVEFFLRPQYHDVINSSCYHSLKFGRSAGWYRLEDVLLFSEIRLFNIDFFGNIQFVKPFGVTLNYPSTSYLMLFGLLCAWLRRSWWLLAIFLGALALMTTKASLFMLLSLLLIPWLARRLTPRLLHVFLWVWCLGYGALAAAWLMLSGKNIHAYSLLASLASVVARPFGGGIGWGGSLTSDLSSRTWDTDMLVGDSGLAVLVNMLGVAGFMAFVAYAQIFIRAARRDAGVAASRERLLVAAFGIGVMGNAILQELAVGPYAVGMAILLLVVVQRQGSLRR